MIRHTFSIFLRETEALPPEDGDSRLRLLNGMAQIIAREYPRRVL